MKDFKDYYSSDQIIKYLCKIRIKYSNQRNKKYLLNKLTTPVNYLSQKSNEYDEIILQQLDRILPKRRMWITNGQRTVKIFVNKANGIKEIKNLDTDEKNREILYNTIKKYQADSNPPQFIIDLNSFIETIQVTIENETYKIEKPDIVPEVKETNKSKQKLQYKKTSAFECRPISRFNLADRIVISLTNKFLTELFDDYFEESSLAFRAVKGGLEARKNHHLAVKKIVDFRKKSAGKEIYVAECDMKKFYDTVNHNKCCEYFANLIGFVKLRHPLVKLDKASYLFNEYLRCYTFKNNVMVLNGDEDYWNKQKDSKQKPIEGFFPWVDDDIYKSNYYQQHLDDRIGVPQGGALSGLIANILLDFADKKLKNVPGLLYVRYCDDMILMHNDELICRQSIELFKNAIAELHLFSHPFKKDFVIPSLSFRDNLSKLERTFVTKNGTTLHRSFEHSYKLFWSSKSKGPYEWGKLDLRNNSIPWVGFVGYEINFNGDIRMRKKSLTKELLKQKMIVTNIIKRIRKDKNARNNAIYRSALEKLVGMSVGRVKLYNYAECENKICWADGFQCLNFNRYSKKQLRTLDRNKYKFLNILKYKLGAEKIKSESQNTSLEVYPMKKPFSYYYQAGERKTQQKE